MNGYLTTLFVFASIAVTVLSYRFVGGGVVYDATFGRTTRFFMLAALTITIGALIGVVYQAHNEASWWEVAACFATPPLLLHLLWRTGEIGHLYTDPPLRAPTTSYGKWLLRMGAEDGLFLRTAGQSVMTSTFVFLLAFVFGLVKFTTPYTVFTGIMLFLAFLVVASAYNHEQNSYESTAVDVPFAEYITGIALAMVSTTLAYGLVTS